MLRCCLVAGLFVLASGVALAQQAPAAPVEIVIDPTANTAQPSRSATLLTGLYATQVTIELCAIALDPAIAAGLAADRQRLERSVSLDAEAAAAAYAAVKADMERIGPDCAEGSPDRQGVDAVTAVYAAQIASSPSGGAPAAQPVSPTEPAPPAEPVAQ